MVLTGHDHFYERIKPQNGIPYFVEGSSGQLREGDLRKGSPLTAKGFDTDQTFMLVEIDKDELTFLAMSRRGEVVDSGVITRRKEPDQDAFAALSLSLSFSFSLSLALSSSFSALRPCFALLRPVRLEDRLHLARDRAVLDDDADLAAAVQLQLAQALAADERARSRRGRSRGRAAACPPACATLHARQIASRACR